MAEKPKKPIHLRGRADLSRMRYIDKQRACIVRGMDFEELVECSAFNLQVWYGKNSHNKINTKLLDDFDIWRKGKMAEKGLDEDEPFIRLGYIGEVDKDSGEVVSIKKPRLMKKQKEKREKDDSLGIFKGTKKALTYQCQQEGKSLTDTVAIVMEAFPEAKDKSIQIWWKKCRRESTKK